MDIEKLDKLRKVVDEQQAKVISEQKLSREDAIFQAEYIIKKGLSAIQPQPGANPFAEMNKVYSQAYAYLGSMGYNDETTHTMLKNKIQSDLSKPI